MLCREYSLTLCSRFSSQYIFSFEASVYHPVGVFSFSRQSGWLASFNFSNLNQIASFIPCSVSRTQRVNWPRWYKLSFSDVRIVVSIVARRSLPGLVLEFCLSALDIVNLHCLSKGKLNDLVLLRPCPFNVVDLHLISYVLRGSNRSILYMLQLVCWLKRVSTDSFGFELHAVRRCSFNVFYLEIVLGLV